MKVRQPVVIRNGNNGRLRNAWVLTGQAGKRDAHLYGSAWQAKWGQRANFSGNDGRAQEIAVHSVLFAAKSQESAQGGQGQGQGEGQTGRRMSQPQRQGRNEGNASAQDQGKWGRALQGVLPEPGAGQVLAHARQDKAAEAAENRGEEQRGPGILGDGRLKKRCLHSQAEHKAHDAKGPDMAVLDDGPESLARRPAAPAVPQVGPSVPVQAPGQVQVEPGQGPGHGPGRKGKPGDHGQDQSDQEADHGIHGHGTADGLAGGDAGAAQAGQKGQGDEEIVQEVHGRGASFWVRHRFCPGCRSRRRAQWPWFRASSMTPWLPARRPICPGGRSAYVETSMTVLPVFRAQVLRRQGKFAARRFKRQLPKRSTYSTVQ